MKKYFAALLAVSMLAACGNSGATATATPEATAEATAEATPEATQEATAPAAEGGLKVGVGSSTSISASDADADKDGSVQYNTTFAGIVLDGDVIKYLYLDVAQDSVKFGVDGTLVSTADQATPTKREKEDAYGMKSASPIGKEWFEQAEGFEQWAVGKTLDEVLNTPTELDGAHTVATDEDLKSVTTISIDGMLAAVKAAADNAVAVDGVAQVGVGSNTSLSMAEASADSDGKTQSNVCYAIAALDGDGKVVFVQTDVAQNSVKFDKEGKILGDAAVAPTKNEKQDAYGMKSASALGKEWFEQNEGFEAWCVGKTLADITATPTEQNGEHMVPADEDLKTVMSIDVTAHLKALDDASQNLSALN